MKKLLSLFFSLGLLFGYSQSLTSSLSACYALDGNANDPINNLNGVLSSVTSTVDRFNNPNSAYFFSGNASSYIELPNSPLLKPSTGVSFSGWVKFNSTSQNHYIVFTSNGCGSFHEGYVLGAGPVGPNFKLGLVKSGNCFGSSQILLNGNSTLLGNTWYHVGMYIGNDSLKIYLNGALDGAMASSVPLLYGTNMNVYLGGTNLSFNIPFLGSMDNVRFYNRKLSGTEFSLLYTTDPACTSTVALTSSLTACYALDGNASEPVNNLTGTLSAVTSTVNRFNTPNSSYYFNGSTSSYIQLPDNPLLKPTNAISFSGWFNAATLPSGLGAYLVFTKNTVNFNFEAYTLSINNTGSGYRFSARKGNSGNTAFAQGTTNISTNTWYHVAFTIDAATIKIYINGVLEATTNSTLSFSYDPNHFVYLGGTNETYNLPFNGTIDNARFYNRVLNSLEVAQLYLTDPSCTPPPPPSLTTSLTACYPLDGNANESINNLNGTLSSVTSTVNRFNIPNSAYSFNGTTSSYIQLPNNPLLKPLNGVSFSAWIKLNSSINQYIVFAKNVCGSYHEGYTLVISNFGTKLAAVKSSTACGPATQHALVGATTLNTGTWYHVGMYVGNDSLKVYLNGALDGAMASAVALNYDANQSVYLGGSNVSFNLPLNGSMDNVRFYNRKLTNSEFNLLYLNDPSCTPPQLSCNTSFLSQSNTSVHISNPGIPNTSTLMPVILPSGANGLAVGPAFGFQAPNPTLWTSVGGTYWYHDGSVFVNTNHSIGVGAFPNFGGSKNFIYGLTPFGDIYAYNGTGNATLLTTIPSFSTLPVADIAGDDLDNFYLLKLNNSPVLAMFNSSGVQTCTYAVSGTPTNVAGGAGLAIVGNSVTVYNGSYYVGTITGSAINFTQTSNSFPVPGDFASCPATTSFVPVITASPSASITCFNPTISLSVSAPVSLSSFTWAGPGIISSVNAPTITVNAPGVYSCSMTSCPGATAIATFTVLSSPSTISILISPSTSTICTTGPAATLTATGATNYTWSPGSQTGSVVTVTPAATTVYTVTGSTIPGCIGTATASVSVINPPTINATANPPAVCPGSTSTLSATGAVSYTWLPSNLTGSSIVVAPASVSIYTVIGTNGICSAATTITVTIGMTPTITTSGNLCNNNSINLFVAPNSPAYTILWTGPGIVGPNNTATITVNAGGTYSVTVTDPNTNCSGAATISINSSANPLSLSITPSSTVTCFPGPAVSLLVSSSANFNWFPPSEVSPNTGPLVSVNPSVTTTYTVIGTLGSCSGSAAVTISVNITPTVLVPAQNVTLCVGQTVTLTAEGASDYSWYPDNLSGQTVTVNPFSPTVYTVTGANGNCTSSNTVSVNVLPLPNLTVSAVPPVICIGHTSTLTVSGASMLGWMTLIPGISFPTLVVNPTVSTTYTAFGTNDFGCGATATISLNVINSPALSVAVSQATICAGESTTLIAGGSTDSYTWSPVNQVGNPIVVSPTVSTAYTVVSGNAFCSYATAVVFVNNCGNTFFGLTNAAGNPVPYGSNFYRIGFTVTAVNASSSDLLKIELNDDLSKTFPPPSTYTIVTQPTVITQNSQLRTNPFFNGSSELSLTMPSTSTLSANARDTLVFSLLLDPNGYSGISRNSVIGFAETTNGFSVSDSSNNGFSWDPDNDGDPTNNNDITLIDIRLIDLFIPEGFSPDGDGTNDLFVISGLNERPVKLTVFNRWGNKVYEKNNYDDSWNGTANTGLTIGSGKLPQATYYYVIQFLDGNKEIRTGFVVLQY